MEANKENKLACLKLIQDFKVLPFFGTKDKNELNLFAKALLKSCRDLAHAGQVVEVWIEGNRELPTPFDLHRLARETKQAAAALPPPCENCHDLPGYIRVSQIVKPPSPFAGETRSALALCGCPRGIALGEAALRARREIQQQPEKGFKPIGELL